MAVATRLIRLPGDLDQIEAILEASGSICSLSTPVLAFYSGNTPPAGADVRQACPTPLRQLAERHGCCVVLVRHLNKAVGMGKAAYRGEGSYSGFTGAARSTVLFGKHPTQAGVIGHGQEQGQPGPSAQSLTYKLVEWDYEEVSNVEWLGECDLTADDLVNGVRGTRRSGRRTWPPSRCAWSGWPARWPRARCP
jgi:hypothetical protein